LSEEDEVLTPKARMQFVRKALGLSAGMVERDVAREAWRKLRDIRPGMNIANVSEILSQAEQYFREKEEAEGGVLTPSPVVRPKVPRAGKRGPRGLPEIYPVGEEPPPPRSEPGASAGTYPQSQVNVYTAGAGGAGSSSSHGHHGFKGSSVDTMEAMLLMQQADLDARSAHRTAMLRRAAQRKHG
jgi:hypothetical protein